MTIARRAVAHALGIGAVLSTAVGIVMVLVGLDCGPVATGAAVGLGCSLLYLTGLWIGERSSALASDHHNAKRPQR